MQQNKNNLCNFNANLSIRFDLFDSFFHAYVKSIKNEMYHELFMHRNIHVIFNEKFNDFIKYKQIL